MKKYSGHSTWFAVGVAAAQRLAKTETTLPKPVGARTDGSHLARLPNRVLTVRAA